MSTEDVNDSRYWFGRLETKIDGLDEKLDHTAEKIGRHEERILACERDIRDLKIARTSDQQLRDTGISGMKTAIVSAVIAALIGGVFIVIQIITHT